MNQIPPEAQRLADHLRKTAEEIESAARYGVPIPAATVELPLSFAFAPEVEPAS